MVGTPETLVEHIKKLQDQSGGFETFLALAHNAADFDATKKSYELFAREVMPHFQRSNDNRPASLNWAAENADRFMEEYVGGINTAIAQHEQEMADKQKKAASNS